MQKNNLFNLCVSCIILVFLYGSCVSASTIPSTAGMELQRELDAVRLELAVITEQARQFAKNNDRAIEIINRTEQRYKDFEAEYKQYAESYTDILDRIEYRNQRIEILIRELWRDYQELRAAIGDSAGQNE